MFKYLFNFFVTLCCLVSFESYSLGTPSTPSASVSGKTVTLSWGTVSGAVYYQLGYRDGYGSWGTSYAKYYNGSQTWTNAPYLIQRSYRMRACDNVTCYGWSGASNQINILPVPNTPSTPSASVSGNRNTLNWSTVDYASTYQVEVSYNNGGWSAQGSTPSTSRTWSNLNEGHRKFRINACNNEGCSAWSGVSNSVEVLKPIPATPSAPSALVNMSTLTLTWGGVNNAQYYKLEYRNGNGSWFASNKNYYGNVNVWHNAESIINRSYRLAACNTSGCSLMSTPSAPVTIYPLPDAPTNLEATFTASTTTLTWKETPYADYFKVQYHDGDGDWNDSDSRLKGVKQIWSTPFTQVRYYRLSGCSDISGCSDDWSDASVVKLGTPMNLKLSNVVNGIELTWNGVIGAGYYKLEYRDGEEDWTASFGKYYGGSQIWENETAVFNRKIIDTHKI